MRRSTKLMLMQEGQRDVEPGRGEYSPQYDGRRTIGFDRDRRPDEGRERYAADYHGDDSPRTGYDGYNGYYSPANSMPYWREYPYLPPNMHNSRTIRGSGSFEMEYPQRGHVSGRYIGRESETMSQPIDERTARMWVERMDGGEHFEMPQAEELRHLVSAKCSPWAFYVAVNMMYSDYSDVARQLGMDKKEFYAHMAKAFMEDVDAKDHKLRRYMDNIAK